MADENLPTYTRLATGRFGLAGFGSLWLGPDHVLLVNNAFGVERYRRWFFKDIQAFVARRNSRRLLLNLIVGGCGLLIAAGTAACIIGAFDADSSADQGVLVALAIILGGVTAICLGFTLANTLLGPGCTTHVQTPLGVEKLSLPGRLNAFVKIAATLTPLIETAQAAQAAPVAPFAAEAPPAPETPPEPTLG